MAKKGSVERNNKVKRLVAQHAEKRERLKAIIKDKSLPAEERFEATLKLQALPRSSSATRIRNRCEVSGRARGYYRKLRMSRIALRELSNYGQVPGMLKSSW